MTMKTRPDHLPPALARPLQRLKTPLQIQAFITAMPPNFEPDGDTVLSVQRALTENRCHCIEGAMIAAYALWLNGESPLLMDMQSHNDSDHVVALFKRHGCWGAISKSNHVWLRYRDPVYKNLRELAMSYFHEYGDGVRRTLRTYSRPYDLRRLQPVQWITNPDQCWDVALAIDGSRHYQLLTPAQARGLSTRDAFEVKAHELCEFAPPRRKTSRSKA